MEIQADLFLDRGGSCTETEADLMKIEAGLLEIDADLMKIQADLMEIKLDLVKIPAGLLPNIFCWELKTLKGSFKGA